MNTGVLIYTVVSIALSKLYSGRNVNQEVEKKNTESLWEQTRNLQRQLHSTLQHRICSEYHKSIYLVTFIMLYGWMEGWMERCMCVWKVGWMAGWMFEKG